MSDITGFVSLTYSLFSLIVMNTEWEHATYDQNDFWPKDQIGSKEPYQ